MAEFSYTEEEYAKIHLAPVKAHDGPVALSPYDPAWPALYEAEAARVRAALGPAADVHHVGSTSIPGISAKPIIDMLLVVADSANEVAYVPALTAQGYRLHVREPDWNEHRLLKGTQPAANLHVFSAGNGEVRRMLAFRDWLRSHDDERALYEATKTELASRTWKYVQHYADAKGEVVEAIIARALAAG
ncbi:GrpB family protein [Caulobacter sp. KR2-114]|uniref:GrpB family protein n=1 Tax=Caulobacter sp. KR2-114 TaxID=3400912 RepID=UPI003BFAABEC